MRRKIIYLIVAFVMSFQGKLFAGIAGSPHDFSNDNIERSSHGLVSGLAEICKICHTPHSAGSSLVPLWRGRLSSTTIYTLYGSDTLDATVNQPLTPTKACLTCHDGSIAKGPVTECGSCHFASSRHPEYPSKNTNLSNNHPVSFVYDTALAQEDGELRNPGGSTVPALGGKSIQTGMLHENRMECTSCHDVHKAKGDSKTAPHLLLVNNNNDGLCLTCHVK